MQRRSLTVVLRSSTFLLWCVIGALLSYGAIYLITPFGLTLVAVLLGAVLAIKSLGGATWPETLGLFAGPGLFCLIVATASENPASLTLIGGAWVGVTVIAYMALGSARCASPSEGP